MLKYVSSFSIHTIIISFMLFVNVSANAYFSNDPQGEIFIKKPFGDISNCGPLSALMLTKFAHSNKHFKNINNSINDARMTVQNQKREDINYRWWTFRDIKKFLTSQQVNYSEIDTKDFRFAQSRSSKIVKAVAAGNAVVVNINMNDLSKNTEIGKPYRTTKLFGRWGHYLVIVGYKKVNGQLAYEIHDSWSTKGKNRLFYAKDINTAITKYNKKLLLVKKGKETQTQQIAKVTQDNNDIFSEYFK